VAAVAFDTLRLARRLRDSAHMAPEQAEEVADALAEAMSGAELATKPDITAAKSELKAEIGAVRSELKADIESVRSELKADFAFLLERIERRAAETETKLVRWMIGTGVAAVLTIVGAVCGTGWAIIRSLPH